MNTKIFSVAAIAFIMLIACNEHKDETSTIGEDVAKKYCSSCHLFPEPSLLDTNTWENSVLPAMGPKLGIRYFYNHPFQDVHLTTSGANTSAQSEIVSLSDWMKIIGYYQKNAPATLPSQNREPIQKFTDRFVTKKVFENKEVPAVTFVKIDEGNKWIYTGSEADSSLKIYNEKLQLLTKHKIHGVIVDMQFSTSLQTGGERSGILTNIGIMNPNDFRTGSADSFHINKDGSISLKQVLNKMPRPVQASIADFDKNGMQDYLVCGFGNTTGALYWMKNKGNQQFEQNIIRPLPGAVKAYIDDYNHDRLPDIMVLMAQAQEGIYLFTNKGDGNFDTKALLQFPPVYGSNYFELDDFNNDGYKDILYTCGDNSDYSRELKNFHGVYIFLNDGKNNFIQKYFFHIHGCYKAIARDFDNDDDLDIATISFFPDLKNQPQEAFVYLENKSDSSANKSEFQFEPYTIKEFSEGKWLTMDAGDIDGDGDEDIVLGSFIRSAQEQSPKPLFLLLENKTKQTH